MLDLLLLIIRVVSAIAVISCVIITFVNLFVALVFSVEIVPVKYANPLYWFSTGAWIYSIAMNDSEEGKK